MKFAFILVAALFFTSGALAQQQPAAPSEITIKVTSAEIALIGEAISALPYGRVAPLFDKLRRQVSEQTRPREQSKATPSPE